MNAILSAVLAGLGGMVGWGFADLFAKKTIDQIGDITTLVVAHFFGTAFLVVLAVYQVLFRHHALTVPSSGSIWAGLLFFGALQAAVYLLVYIGFGKGQVAILNPFFSSFSGIVALISIVFLGEIVTASLLFALLIVFIGIMLMNVDIEALRNRRIRFLTVPGLIEVAIATILAAMWTLGWNTFVSNVDWLAYAVGMYLAMTITLVLYALIRGISLRVTIRTAWKYLVLIGIFEAGAYVAISWGYGATSATSIVAVLSGAFSLPTIIGARVWLKEKTTRLQFVGSICIIIGIALVALL